jgi:hypothetical protein
MKLEYITIKICEKLPLNFTLFEEKGLCTKPNNLCIYCKKNELQKYLCDKKTYTIDFRKIANLI